VVETIVVVVVALIVVRRRDVVHLLGAQQAIDLGLDVDREDLAVLEAAALWCAV
jgi:ABC-type Fe3+-siderophore transport system permease subunit